MMPVRPANSDVFGVAEMFESAPSCPSTGLGVDHNANDDGVEADS